MFQRILVPLNDPAVADAALRIATGVALRTDAEVVLVRSEPGYTPARNVIGARTTLQRQVNMLRQQGIHAEYVVETGSAEAVLVAAARERHADLILLVPATRQQLELLWYPRSASRTLNELPAPLLVWPETQATFDGLLPHDSAVMAPLDGAEPSERSLPFAVKIAERYRSPLVLIRAIPTDDECMYRDSIHGAACFSDQVQEAQTYLRSLQDQLMRTTRTPIESVVVAGEPGTQLVRAAERYRAGVIVLCSHSHPTHERYFMGCVATQLLREAPVPILIVPQHLQDAHLAASDNVAAIASSTVAGVTA